MIARRLMAGSWEGLRVRRTVYRLGRIGALTAVNNFPAVRFSQASAVTDLCLLRPTEPLVDCTRSCASPVTGRHDRVSTGF